MLFVGFRVLPRNRLAAHPLPPGDALFLPSFLGSFLNCLVVKLNRQEMNGGGVLVLLHFLANLDVLISKVFLCTCDCKILCSC